MLNNVKEKKRHRDSAEALALCALSFGIFEFLGEVVLPAMSIFADYGIIDQFPPDFIRITRTVSAVFGLIGILLVKPYIRKSDTKLYLKEAIAGELFAFAGAIGGVVSHFIT